MNLKYTPKILFRMHRLYLILY